VNAEPGRAVGRDVCGAAERAVEARDPDAEHQRDENDHGRDGAAYVTRGRGEDGEREHDEHERMKVKSRTDIARKKRE
jgi:hypothetical protein